jgi:DNA-binding transcriptional regulator YdaS (Cro superfamily)
METPIENAVAIAGGRQALAMQIGLKSSSYIRNWIVRGRGKVPAEYVISIERATNGAVRCEDLRPDVDWQYLRGTAPADKEAA